MFAIDPAGLAPANIAVYEPPKSTLKLNKICVSSNNTFESCSELVQVLLLVTRTCCGS